MKYTKKQLVKAMRRWNDDLANNPDDYDKDGERKAGKKYAKNQVKALLNFVK